jgi:heme/copper-type cytochrome/quinol oxidase subunit 3
MSRIFWYYLFSIYVLFSVLFYLFFVLLVFGRRYYLDAANFGNLQDLQEQDFEQ